MTADDLHAEVLAECRAALPGWRDLTVDDVDFDAPKGFSSFTMGVRPRATVDPPAVLYRRLAGKDNAILDFDTERDVYLLLSDAGIAAHCLHYDDGCRIEAFYRGRTLAADDVFDTDIQRGVAAELARFHRLEPPGLPDGTFFELLIEQWGDLARSVLIDHRSVFPPHEQEMCADLEQIWLPETADKVMRCVPDGDPVFCHNDTYHGNTFLLDDGSVRLLDFEFSCLNHPAFDIANFFAETAMEHGLADPPHFRIAEPRYTDADLAAFIAHYLDHTEFADAPDRAARAARLLVETRHGLMLSDFMYSMAALPLALEPIQKIRFIPYAHQRFHRFLARWETTFG